MRCCPGPPNRPCCKALACPPMIQQGPAFLKFDIWHNWHGGLGKHLVASSVAELLPNMEFASAEAKMPFLNNEYLAWRKTSMLRLHAGQLDLELFGLDTGMQGCPTGSWSKFNDTRILLAFLEWFLGRRWHFVPTEITEEALRAISSSNKCFRILYSSGWWLTPEQAKSAGHAGLSALASHARLAHMTLQELRARFPWSPRLIMFITTCAAFSSWQER